MAELSENQAALFLARNFANVATIRPDGTPHVSPVWVDFDGEDVIFNTALGRAKERHLRRDPRLTISVVDHENPYQYVEVTGTAELTEEGADDHIDRMSQKYRGVAKYASRQPGERRVLVRVRAERVFGNVS